MRDPIFDLTTRLRMVKVSRSKGLKSFSLVDAKVVDDLRTARGAMAQLSSPHIPQQFIYNHETS